jgi:hypothetical protein
MSATDTDDARRRPRPERPAPDTGEAGDTGDTDTTNGPRIADLTFFSYADSRGRGDRVRSSGATRMRTVMCWLRPIVQTPYRPASSLRA